MLGGKCVHCGNTDHRCLQVDHIDGGGTKERKEFDANSLYRKIVRGHKRGYQLLCANCNWIKRWENQETPIPRPYTAPEKDGVAF